MIQPQPHPHPAVTELLLDWQAGDQAAGHVALAAVYEELRHLARRYMNREAVGATLQPTALVHEAFMRLVGENTPIIKDRAHLIGLAARLMRQILINKAAERNAIKRGRGWKRCGLDPTVALFEDRCIDLLALHEALTRLAEHDSRQSQIVEMRFFGGMSVEDTAQVLDISVSTVEREWTFARTWLRREVSEP